VRIGQVDRRVIAALTQTREVQTQMRAVANEVRKRARQKAPKRTGRLRRSIRVERERDIHTKEIEFRVGWDKSIAWYGAMVELGTERTRARPHLRPAADEINNEGR
jgi:HK97 gp10 family phage protein